ncbi:MAG: hypothetical protein HRT47_12195 [Candidatus Caenarcaniphilales bacterium]|nr:hypothetical protein [Candidatus Caenarcaniphilales bacterium]
MEILTIIMEIFLYISLGIIALALLPKALEILGEILPLLILVAVFALGIILIVFWVIPNFEDFVNLIFGIIGFAILGAIIQNFPQVLKGIFIILCIPFYIAFQIIGYLKVNLWLISYIQKKINGKS